MDKGAKEEGGTPLIPLDATRRDVNLPGSVAVKCWERGSVEGAGKEWLGKLRAGTEWWQGKPIGPGAKI